ncbi:MAG: heme-binding protein [Burkholderiaceae bacterium]
MNPTLPSLICGSLALIGVSAQSQGLRPTLMPETAQAIVQGCQTLAGEKGWRMAVAVNDEAGQLLLFSRMAGAAPISVPVSQLKANTSSALPISTRQFRAASASNRGAEWLDGITTVAGGLPITDARGQALGSVGVSGGNEDQDEQCAQAGLDAVKGLLP